MKHEKWKGPYKPVFEIDAPRLMLCPHIELLLKRIDFEYESETDIGVYCRVCEVVHVITVTHP